MLEVVDALPHPNPLPKERAFTISGLVEIHAPVYGKKRKLFERGEILNVRAGFIKLAGCQRK